MCTAFVLSLALTSLIRSQQSRRPICIGGIELSQHRNDVMNRGSIYIYIYPDEFLQELSTYFC